MKNHVVWIGVLAVTVGACKESKQSGLTESSRTTDSGSGGPVPSPPSGLADAASLPIATEDQTIHVPFMVNTKTIAVKGKVPVGWRRRGPLAVWDPPDANTLPMWRRSFSMTATCDGVCTSKELSERIPKLLDVIKAHHIKPKMSGDPVKDEATVAPVTELERGELPQGGAFILLRVEKPVGSTDPYPDLFVGSCITRRNDDEFFVRTDVRAAPDDETTWWPVLVEACKATTIDASTPSRP